MNLKNFCTEIGLSQAMTCRVLALEPEIRPIAQTCDKLLHPSTWDQGMQETHALLGDDPDGVKILTCMLLLCEKTWDVFQEHHLSREIFRDTMGCFPRFIGEHVESYGTEAFDRSWWTVRQISGVLFRIGTLEYELLSPEDTPRISIHIPSDADLSMPALRDSYDRARELIDSAFPRYAGAPMICDSWLLGPQLADLLPENSRILGFQRAFRLTAVHDTDAIRLWVFKDPRLSNEDLPENTFLQRSLKRFLLDGGVFQLGEGILQEPAFR